MFRNFLPVARAARPCWKVAVRGKKDLPLSFWRRPQSVWDDPRFSDFFRPMGVARAMDEHFRDTMARMDRAFNRPLWRESGLNAELVQADLTKEGFQIKLNVSHYDPEELSIKVVGDRLVISGKHSQKPDEHGYVTREFTRELLIPEEVDQDTLASQLTEDGHLIISARVKAAAEPEGRTINIQREAGDSDSRQKE